MAHENYSISDLPKASADFRAVFNTGLGQFRDSMLTAMSTKVVIDIVAFNKHLEKEHPGPGSINSKVLEHYGQAGIDLLNKLSL